MRWAASLLLAVVVLSSVSVSAAAKNFRGGFGADRFQGTASADRMTGGYGKDRLSGAGGADTIAGGYGADYLGGGGGRDTLRGDGDNDRLDGGDGADRLEGGDGDDRIAGGAGNDQVKGGDGDDQLTTAGGGVDRITCGAGEDRVTADSRDTAAADCEVVTPPAIKPVGSTRERPFPLGQAVATPDGWQMQVVGFKPDATASVLAENIFNDPPAPGTVFALVRVRATRTGPAPDRFSGSFRLRAVGPSAVVYSTFQNSCGVVPDELPDPEVFPGGVIEGNECWAVPTTDAASLVLIDTPIASERQTFVALR
jgi:hypothetical protein